MSDYFITGKKGHGKTLITIARINEYLEQGKRVATNINIFTEFLPSKFHKTVITRLPDKPIIENMDQLGTGYDFIANPDNKTDLGYSDGEYDEKKFGIIVLDELGTWFNTRDFQKDPKRKLFLDWVINARKLGWDVYYLVQDIDMVDKQLRDGHCEHLVVCKRSDVYKLLGMKPPKWHKGTIYDGSSPSKNLKIGKWLYAGLRFYKSYNTKQVFSNNLVYEGNSSLLPYEFTKQYIPVKKKFNFKQYLKTEYALILLLASSTIYSQLALSGLQDTEQKVSTSEASKPGQLKSEKSLSDLTTNKTIPYFDAFGDIRISGMITRAGVNQYLFESEQYGNITSDQLKQIDIKTTFIRNCLSRLSYQGQHKLITCQELSDKSIK